MTDIQTFVLATAAVVITLAVCATAVIRAWLAYRVADGWLGVGWMAAEQGAIEQVTPNEEM